MLHVVILASLILPDVDKDIHYPDRCGPQQTQPAQGGRQIPQHGH